MKKSAVLFILFFGILFLCSGAQAESVNGNKVIKLNPKEFLISKLQQVADSGNLFEPNAISKILEIHFKISTEAMPKLVGCSDNASAGIGQKTVISVIENNWFHALPSGIRKMKIPQPPFSLVPAAGKITYAEKPALSYGIAPHVFCDKDHPIQHEDSSSAILYFKGLPSYSCIEPEDIQRLLPKARYVSATDGHYTYQYQGQGNDVLVTNLTFYFLEGAPCSINVLIEQNREYGRQS